MPPAAVTPLPEPTRSCPAVDPGAGAVRWFFPVVPADNRALERWCRTLGPVVIDSIPRFDFGELGLGDSLVIAVWNVNAGAGDLLAFLREELRLDCGGGAPAFAAGAPHFVLLLQEALRRSSDVPDGPRFGVVAPAVPEERRPGPRLGVVEVARRCGLSLFYGPQARNGFETRDGLREDRGPAVLSTLPLSDFVMVELPLESSRRVVPIATVGDGRGHGLRVASVHLITTPPPWRVLATGNTARLRQAMGLVDALDRLAASRDPRPTSTLIAGDLNTWSTREAALRFLRGRFPDSPPALTEPTRGPYPTDHVLFRRTAASGAVGDRIVPGTYRRVGQRYHSDHHPVAAYFTFGR